MLGVLMFLIKLTQSFLTCESIRRQHQLISRNVLGVADRLQLFSIKCVAGVIKEKPFKGGQGRPKQHPIWEQGFARNKNLKGKPKVVCYYCHMEWVSVDPKRLEKHR